MSFFAPSPQEASPLDVATVVSDHEADAHDELFHDADPQDAVFHDAEPHEAAFQEAVFHDASAFAAFPQLAASNTRPEPPAGSETTYLSSARFGFGGLVTAAALSALTSPTPREFGAAAGGATAASINAPFT